MLRRSSAGIDGHTTVPVRANFEEMRHHFKHLGPSNPATNPKETRSTTVKIKPGTAIGSSHLRSTSIPGDIRDELILHADDETTGLLMHQDSGSHQLLQAFRQGYGSAIVGDINSKMPENYASETAVEDDEEYDAPAKPTLAEPNEDEIQAKQASAKSSQAGDPEATGPRSSGSGSGSAESAHSNKSDSGKALQLAPKRSCVRSGSITENIVESRGVRKVVLETQALSPTADGDETMAATVPSGSILNIPVGPGHDQATVAVPVAGHVSEGEDGGEAEAEAEAEEGTAATGSSAAAAQTNAPGKKKNRRKKRKGGHS